jgi:bifunctional non-homologous end joining protein LigD
MDDTEYQRKRDFHQTPEPSGDMKNPPVPAGHIFVIQKHAARHLHYDFRLEAGGTLKSWAIPKGFPETPGQKHLAVHVEDHPLEYKNFEGVIPSGNYGAGTVMIWDTGTYRPAKNENPDTFILKGLENGHFSVFLEGHKIRGGFSLYYPGSIGKNNWIITKRDDDPG